MNTATRASLAAAWFLVLGCSTSPETSSLKLVDLPAVALDAMEPAVQAQLREEREGLETLLAEPAPDDHALGEAFGELGRLYQAYDLPQAAIACYRNAQQLQPDVFRWPYLLGYLSHVEGDSADAERALADALRLRQDDAPANLWAGHVALGLDKISQADRFFAHALEADPACAGARFGQGEAARRNGDLEAAIEHFRAALSRQPSATQVHYPLARALQSAGREVEAQSHFRLAAERGAPRGGWASCADPEITAVRKLATGAAAAVLRASEAGASGSSETELAEYRRAVDANPKDAIARRGLGSALWDSGDAEGAIEHLKKAIELQPDDPSMHYDLGFVYAKTGQLAGAEEHLQRAVELHPDHAEAHLMLGTLYQRHRLFEPAVAHYERVLARQPNQLNARLQRALALAELERRDEAKADLRRLAEDAPPNDPQDRLNLASALAMLGDAGRADELLHDVAVDAELATDLRARAHFNRGMLALQTGAAAEAARAFSAASELVPGFEEATRGLEQARRLMASASTPGQGTPGSATSRDPAPPRGP